jgi:hypothetical protein
MANLSLYDLTVLQRNDRYTGVIEDVTTLPREWETIEAVRQSGWWYKVARRVVLPTAQFRSPNIGTTSSKSVWRNEIKEMLFIDTQIIIDESVWDADDGSLGNVWMNEAEGVFRAAGILIGQQFYYGTAADPNGFLGIRSQMAGITYAGAVANSTSAYLVWEDTRHGVRFDVGKDGNFALSAPERQLVADPNNSGKNFFAYVGNLKGYVGLFVGSNLSCWGICGITTTVTSPGTNGLTDFLAMQLYSSIPAMRRNKLRWYMNRTAEAVLQQNRSAVTNATGIAQYQPAGADGRPAYSPLPNMLNGWPIEITDSILNTETN